MKRGRYDAFEDAQKGRRLRLLKFGYFFGMMGVVEKCHYLYLRTSAVRGTDLPLWKL
jgi:hypothetical protein